MELKCALCGSKDVIKHHVSYQPERIVWLCRSCHRKVHNPKRKIIIPHEAVVDVTHKNLVGTPDKHKKTPISEEQPLNTFNKWLKEEREKWKARWIEYTEIYPTLLSQNGDVIACDGKYFWEKHGFYKPCDDCPYFPCIEWCDHIS